MPALRLYLLGRLDIRYHGQVVPKPPTTNAQSLLAYLALHRERPQPRERLAALFWGERPERKARRSLTTALWHIRRSLPDEALLLSDVHSVQFDPQADLWLDLAEFEVLAARRELSSLQSAVALYRGDFMDGFYDDWVLNERYRLEMVFSEVLARLMAGLEAREQHDRALGVALRLLEHDPLREDARRLAMRAYCHLGHRNTALEQYRRCREIVGEELNTEPMEETTALYQDILDGRFEIGPTVEALAAERAAEPPRPPGQNPLDPVVRGPVVGRETELAFLRDRYQEARTGPGSLVLLPGEAGVGKTRLVEELADHLRWQGVRVLWGRCYEFERLLPYQPVSEALQTVLPTISPGDLTHLPSWILREVARLVPQVRDRQSEPRESSETFPDQQRAQLFEAVARFIAWLSTQSGLALMFEDLHWATESTLQMVHYLARHLADGHAVIVGTLRPEAVGPQHPLRAFQRQLTREGLVRTLELKGLSRQSVETLVTEMSGCGEAVAPLAQRLYEDTEGNPFFLIETIKALFEEKLIRLDGEAWQGDFAGVSRSELPLPAGVSEAIQARVHRLEPEARRALQTAAALGREFDFDLLAAAWHREEETTLEALDALLRHRFVDEGSAATARDYVFHHHKIQEVVYAEIPRRHRQRLHARAGRAMERLYEPDRQDVAGELAFHFSRARLADEALAQKAVRYLLLAGDQARLAYARREAIDYYSQALALQKEQGEYEGAARTLMKLGLVHETHFDFTQARQAFDEAFALRQQASTRRADTSRSPAPHPLRIRWRSPYGLDPAFNREYASAVVLYQLFSGLVSEGPDLDLVPEVARRWEVSEGGCRYRFYLRPNARWSDGTPLTARDFEYAWKRQLDPAAGGPASNLLAIKGARAFHRGESIDPDRLGVRALDSSTLEVVLEEPVSYFLYELATASTYPVPQHVVAAQGPAWTDVDKIVTNGPFMLEPWERGESMTLVRNPLYPGRRRGNVERVVLRFPEPLSPHDLSEPLEQYERGDLDVLTLMDASVQEGDRLRRQFAAEYVSAPWLFTVYLGFVTDRPPFDDVRVRQALAMAVDREALADVALRGMYAPGTGGLVPPGMPGHSPGIGLPYHPRQARQLLAAAGHPGGRGFPDLEALRVPPIDPLITRYLQSQWQDNLGVSTGWNVLHWPPFCRRLQQDPPHLYILAQFADSPDPGIYLAIDDIRDTRWERPAFEELTEKARHITDQRRRIELLRQADQILLQETPIVPLIYGRQHLLVKPWVSNFATSPLSRWDLRDTIIQPH